jgi:hypothetical protein
VRLLAAAVLGLIGACGGMNEPPLQAPPPPIAEPLPPRAPKPPPSTDGGAKPDAAQGDDLDLG